MKFEVKKTGTIIKEFDMLEPGDIFYLPDTDVYYIKVEDSPSNHVNAVDLIDGTCHFYSYEEVVPVTVKMIVENPYLCD